VLLRYGRGFATVSVFIKREETPAREMRGAIENRLTRAMASLCHYFEQRETLRVGKSREIYCVLHCKFCEECTAVESTWRLALVRASRVISTVECCERKHPCVGSAFFEMFKAEDLAMSPEIRQNAIYLMR